MPHDRDTETLIDIAEAARFIEDFTRGFSAASFGSDRKTQSSVVHQMLVIGEAVKRLSPAFCSAHAEIPWSAYARMRDRMIHRYDEILAEEGFRVRQAAPYVTEPSASLPRSCPSLRLCASA